MNRMEKVGVRMVGSPLSFFFLPQIPLRTLLFGQQWKKKNSFRLQRFGWDSDFFVHFQFLDPNMGLKRAKYKFSESKLV